MPSTRMRESPSAPARLPPCAAARGTAAAIWSHRRSGCCTLRAWSCRVRARPAVGRSPPAVVPSSRRAAAPPAAAPASRSLPRSHAPALSADGLVSERPLGVLMTSDAREPLYGPERCLLRLTEREEFTGRLAPLG